MTAIKQVAVTSTAHLANLAKYLDSDKALTRDSQHLLFASNWSNEMHATREVYGHNSPSRAGAANTYMYHQVIAFNPDECSCNGGVMTPERCMEFARDWVSSRYPNHEAIWVLHQEHCTTDGTDRFAVHIGINRTDLETGKRLHEGRGHQAKRDRAAAMRELDEKWRLSQMVRGQRNSRIHAMQPTKAERSLKARDITSDKEFIRERVQFHLREIRAENHSENRMRELSVRLAEDGVSMTLSKSGKQLNFRRGHGRTVSGHRLGRGFSLTGIVAGLGIRFAKEMVYEAERSMDS